MVKGFFITGTDTNVGKTWVTVAMMRYFKQQGKSVAGMKPVASGCSLLNTERGNQLINADALLLQENASTMIDYDLINPYAYELPVSPHIAGIKNPVKLEVIHAKFLILKGFAEIVLVEGAGGWYSPINDGEDMSDLAKSLGLPIILVVAIRLGCISQAKLTWQAIQRSGLSCAGWIAVCIEQDMLMREQNIQRIQHSLDARLLGVFPYLDCADFDLLASKLHI